MAIPDTIVEEIKSRSEITDVISAYVSLNRRGANMVGLCPFHGEKTPSFTVFVGTQSYYCFGCGAAGDVITFVRKRENLGYEEAVRLLASRCGVTVPEEDKGGVRRTKVYEINREAAKFFRSTLMKTEQAKAYLIKRGLGGKTVARFGLGYSGTGFELYRHLTSLGYKDEEMAAASLIRIRNGKVSPFFRERIMFPIIDVSGSVIGFGGRITGNGEPKYLNTPDTVAFSKGRNLFALNYAKDNCKDGLILCEGYMDVIAMHAAGFRNAVATLGTALTADQARLMKRYADKVIISYDGDRAGKAATARATSILTENGLDVRILNITGAKDPDEYIKSYGADAFARLLKGSETKFEYMMSKAKEKYDFSTDEGKIKAAKELSEQTAKVSSAVERELYTVKVAAELGVSKESFDAEVKKARRRAEKESGSKIKQEMQNKSLGIGDRINPEHSQNPKAVAAEEALLGIMMLHPERAVQIRNGRFDLGEGDFVTEFSRRLFVSIMKLQGEGKTDIGMLGGEYSDAEMSRIYEIQVRRNGLDSASEEVFDDNIKALRKAKATKATDIDEIIRSKQAENSK